MLAQPFAVSGEHLLGQALGRLGVMVHPRVEFRICRGPKTKFLRGRIQALIVAVPAERGRVQAALDRLLDERVAVGQCVEEFDQIVVELNLDLHHPAAALVDVSADLPVRRVGRDGPGSGRGGDVQLIEQLAGNSTGGLGLGHLRGGGLSGGGQVREDL